MCLGFLAFQMNDADPVMLGANREESRSRPSTSPVCSRINAVPTLAAGANQGPDGTFPEVGTWLGVNETGLVVAVTNRRDGTLAWADQVRSRGLLAVALLAFDDPAAALRLATDALALGGYGGCNYLIANRDAAYIIQAPRAQGISASRIAPGLHAMTNLDLDDRDDSLDPLRLQPPGALTVYRVRPDSLPRPADHHLWSRAGHCLVEPGHGWGSDPLFSHPRRPPGR